jgi:myo-inositol catabolism protein IolC
MAPGYDRDLYILAFDHRGSFQKKLMGIEGTPSDEEARRIVDAKTVIFEGLLRALDQGAPREAAGALVDEQFGADVARRAAKEGLVLAMPVEKSGQDEFDFEYGEAFGDHIEAFDATFAKVLVRYNPEGDLELNARQLVRLRELSEWLQARERKFLFELLVPAEPSQLEAVGGDLDRFEREARPGLMLRAIRDLRAGGVEPDVWKLEGLDDREHCRAVSDLARSDGREGVACVVLGRGADDRAVERWLRAAAGVPGYVGFAIGRTIWWDPLAGYLEGSLDRDGATERIAAAYRHMVDVYRGEAGLARRGDAQ